MKIVTEENNYYTVGDRGDFRTVHIGALAAIAAAERFVKQWAEHNVAAEATVYYRDGSVLMVVS